VTDREARRRSLRDIAARAGLSAVLVTHLPDVCYLCGFSGSNGALLVTRDGAVLATDGRYVQQAAAQAPDVELLVTRRLVPDLLVRAGADGVDVVGFDPDHLSVSAWRATSAGRPRLEPADMDLSGLRQVKDASEIAAVEQACRISTQALGVLLEQVRVGDTEVQIARQLELLMGLAGADDRAFETIVAAGENSAVPHHDPSSRPIRPGDLLKIDFGAKVGGYHADCTRTFIVGAQPEAWQWEIHDTVRRAQSAGIAALRPGIRGREVDAAARAVIVAAGYGSHFGHGLGHGVGLEIHEAPYLGESSANTVEAGTLLTVEPGVYLPGRGGVRIEDTLLVTDDAVRALTDFPRALARIG
jgi:Xaa-Pro dipeptidase